MAVPEDMHLADIASGRLSQPPDGVPAHAGLALAEALAQVPEGDFPLLLDVMKAAVTQYKIMLGSPEHEALLAVVTDKNIQDHSQRQQFFRELFARCTANSNGSSTCLLDPQPSVPPVL